MHQQEQLLQAGQELVQALNSLTFGKPVSCTYNPLEYAWEGYEAYVRRFAGGKKRTLFLGMNPGPFGMAQTGVPFGEVNSVVEWMKISCLVKLPEKQHPKRPIEGFGCPRTEVSGKRLWGLFQELFGTAEEFFAQHYVLNYCPLLWMAESGANITPDKLPITKRQRIDAACQRHLCTHIELMDPEIVVGVGAYATQQLASVIKHFPERNIKLGQLLHPSPASPVANKQWPELPKQQLRDLNII